MHGQTLNTVKDTKYSGVPITLFLDWNIHINKITARQGKPDVRLRETQHQSTVATPEDKGLQSTGMSPPLEPDICLLLPA